MKQAAIRILILLLQICECIVLLAALGLHLVDLIKYIQDNPGQLDNSKIWVITWFCAIMLITFFLIIVALFAEPISIFLFLVFYVVVFVINVVIYQHQYICDYTWYSEIVTMASSFIFSILLAIIYAMH